MLFISSGNLNTCIPVKLHDLCALVPDIQHEIVIEITVTVAQNDGVNLFLLRSVTSTILIESYFILTRS